MKGNRKQGSEPTVSQRGSLSPAIAAAYVIIGLYLASGTEAATLAYIANTPYGVVKVIDTGTMTEAAPPITVGSYPDAVAVSPDGRRAYVINSGDSTLSVIDTASNAVVGNPIGIGFATDVAVSPDSQTIYVTSSEEVLAISATTLSVAKAIQACPGGGGNGLAVTPDGLRVYVACQNFQDGEVAVIDTATNSVLASHIASGVAHFDLAITPDGSMVYVIDFPSSTVTVISTASNSVVATIPVDFGMRGLAVTPDGSRVYISNYDYDYVAVVSVATNTLIGPKIHVGTAPNGIAITPDGRDVYVVNRAEAFVSIIDVASNTVTSLPGFNGPIMWGKFIGPAASVITLESSLNPSLLGQSVTFTATVNGGTPTGSIAFSDGSTPLGSVALLNSGMTGTATLTTADLTVGDHSISATYAGNAYGLSATASLHQVVDTAVANRSVMAPALSQWSLFLLAVLVTCGAGLGLRGMAR